MKDREKLVAGALAVVAAGLLIWFGINAVSPGIDATYSLAWGAVLGGGVRPDIISPLSPLAHPLPIAIGVVVSPLSPTGAYDVLGVLAALSYGLLLYGAFRLARALVGPGRGRSWALAAGILTVALVLLRPRLEYFALYAVVEVPFTALLLLALSFVIEDPRGRPWLPLALLVPAGLLRPDAWLLGIAYCGWLAYDGMRGRRLALCAVLALAAPLIWLVFAGILTDDPLSPISGNPSAQAVEEFGFNVSPEKAYTPSLGDALDKNVGGVRSLIGYPLAIAGTLVAILALVARSRDRPGPERWRLAIVVGSGVLLFAQTVVLALLGAPVAERYAFGPALLLVVLVAVACCVPRSTAFAAALIACLLAVMVAVDPDKPKQIKTKLDAFTELRAENDDLLSLTERPIVRGSVNGNCPNIYVGGKNRTRSLSARPVVAMAFDRDPIHVHAARAPRGKLQAAIFRRDLPVGPPPYETLGVWTFRSACLKGVETKRANRDRDLRERQRQRQRQ
jgi:hypothetical protein